MLSRGDRAESIFADDEDRKRFLETLGEGCRKTGWQVHAFVFMPNHFHLLLRTPRPNLVEGMQWMLGTYTVRYNARHGVRGHLFAGRYRSQLVSPANDYAAAVQDYIHLNPARAGLLQPGQPLRDYPWSSLRALLGLDPRPAWLVASPLAQGTMSGPGPWEARLESWRDASMEIPLLGAIRRDWCLGEASFREAMLARVAAGAGAHHHGEELAEAAEARAELLVRRELARLAWTEEDLGRHAKGDGRKLALARRLRAESTMTLSWIADRLGMGTAGYLSHLLYWGRRGMKPPKPAKLADPLTPPVQPRRAAGLEKGRGGRRVPRAGSMGVKAPEPAGTPPEPFAFDTSFD